MSEYSKEEIKEKLRSYYKETEEGIYETLWETIMPELVSDFSEPDIAKIKEDLNNFTEFYTDKIIRPGKLFPPKIDMWDYKKDHNYMTDGLNVSQQNMVCRKGICFMMDDIKNSGISSLKNDITSILPTLLVDDLVIRHRVKKDKMSLDGKPKITYSYTYYDESTGLLFYSNYEKNTYSREKENVNTVPILLANKILPTPTEAVNSIDLIISAAIPIEAVYGCMIVGLSTGWKRTCFENYPVFLTWHEDKAYVPFKKFFKNDPLDDGMGVLMEIFDNCIGMHRYLLSLAEQREKIVIEPDATANKSLPKPVTDEDRKTYRQKQRSIISLSESVKIYTHDAASTRRIRKPKKCQYRFSVRTHVRHYKNGKTVLVKSFDKNKNFPYKGHQYTQ